MKLCWNRAATPAELYDLLETLGEEYPIVEGSPANFVFEKSEDVSRLAVKKEANIFHITFGDAGFAARGIAYALADRQGEEKIFFTTHAVLLDCSRTGVVTVEYFKRYLRRIALLGFNLAMLYTKDAYQLPGEPYFGYMRGAYTREEIREIDAYAKKLHIEMIASIQALGHLEPVLRWSAYKSIRDTENVLLTTSDQSYALLEKMISFWSDALDSRRIHLGMDETHDLGRGKYMDQNGYKRGFDIFNEHLKKVCGICKKFQLKPIIWNDMYFKFASADGTYYNLTTEVPADVRAAIPRDVQTSYWDYYHRDKETYLTMLKKSQQLNGKMPLMATGIWTWGELWCDYGVTDLTTRPCIDACKELGVNEIVYAMWGDDGGYCEFDSAFAAMARVADYAFNDTFDDERTRALFAAVCGADYAVQIALGDIQMPVEDKPVPDKVSAPALLWDDPLMNIYWRDCWKFDWERVLKQYRALRELAERHRDDNRAGQVNHAWNVLNVLVRKIEIRMILMRNYAKRDFDNLEMLCEREIPEMLDALEGLNDSFRAQWFRSYKSYGLEVMQIRLAGLRERYLELARRIDELLDGERDRIEELEIPLETIYQPEYRYRMLATGGWFI